MNCDVQTIGLIGTVIGILGGICAVIFGIRSWRQSQKTDDRHDGQTLGTVQSDLGYIKSGVDDLKIEVRELRTGQSNLTERVRAVEESARQAHKRLDELKNDGH